MNYGDAADAIPVFSAHGNRRKNQRFLIFGVIGGDTKTVPRGRVG